MTKRTIKQDIKWWENALSQAYIRYQNSPWEMGDFWRREIRFAMQKLAELKSQKE